MHSYFIHRQRIAPTAVNGCNDQLIGWVTDNRAMLVQHGLIAMGATGEQLEATRGVPVRKI